MNQGYIRITDDIYRNEWDELCYPASYFFNEAKENGLNEIELFQAIPEKIGGMFWCREYESVCENGCCGKQCDEYIPRNKKSGICTHHSKTFYTIGAKEIFKIGIDNKEFV